MHCINNMNRIASGLIIASCVFYSCTSRSGEIPPVHGQQTDSLLQDTIVQPEVKPVDKNSQQSRYKSLKICCTTNIHWMISILIKTLPGSFNGIKSKNSWPYSKIYSCSLPRGQFSRITKQEWRSATGEKFQKKCLRTSGRYARYRTLSIRSTLFAD